MHLTTLVLSIMIRKLKKILARKGRFIAPDVQLLVDEGSLFPMKKEKKQHQNSTEPKGELYACLEREV